MIQGTTPTHEFVLPFAAELVKEVRITYEQNGEIVLEKAETDCTFVENSIKLELTQEETLLFDTKYNVKIQLKVLTTEGKVMASQIESVRVGEILNKEVLTV